MAKQEVISRNPSLFDCFRFASIQDYFILILGLFLASVSGAGMSAFDLTNGLALNSFLLARPDSDSPDININFTFAYIVIGLGMFIGTFGSRCLLRLNAQRQGYKLRNAYISALLQQDISFYGSINPMELSTQMENDFQTITDSLDNHLRTIFSTIGALAFGLTGSFLRAWEVSLVLLVMIPLLLMSMIVYDRISTKAAEKRSVANAKAGTIVEEALTNIRTVASLGGERIQLDQYQKAAAAAEEALSSAGILQGISFGFSNCSSYLISVAVILIGFRYVQDEKMNSYTGRPYAAGDVYAPIAAVFAGFYQVPVLGASVKALSGAKASIKKIVDFIDDVKAEESHQVGVVKNFKGAISFKNVTFAYPSRLYQPVLKNISLNIEPGQKIAIVGGSGSGKTSIFQLLERFYDFQNGSIELDGVDIKSINKTWLRKNIAYVGQEPVLFSMTIRENLRLAKEDATEDEIILALKRANAYDFVMHTENKLDTRVGGGTGTQLSGGQKQRLAIARAILKDAKIILLDGATSALDRLNEREVQQTLSNLPGKPTLITIAHRLSTIREVNKIIVLEKGHVEEIGTHEELMEKRGKYFEKMTHGLEARSRARSGASVKSMQKLSFSEDDDWIDVSEDNDEYENEEEEEMESLLRRRKMSLHKSSDWLSNPDRNEEGEERNLISWTILKQLWTLAKQERKYFLLGFIGAFGYGISFPVTEVFLANAIDTLVAFREPDFEEKIYLYCILLCVCAAVTLVCCAVQMTFLAKASETFVITLKSLVFFKFLRMHIGWHDDPQHSPGNLAAKLEVDAANVGQLTGTSLGIILQILFVTMIALLIAFLESWKLALAETPIIILIIFVAFKLSSIEAKGEQETHTILSRAEVIISEILNNMKTVISLNSEKYFVKEYNSILNNYEEAKLKTRMKNALLEGSIYLILFIDFGLVYYLTAYLIYLRELSASEVFFPFISLSFFTFCSTQIFILTSDAGKAMHSVRGVLDLISLKSQIDSEESKPAAIRGEIQGNIEFKNVHFTYPANNITIFNDLNFKIYAGQQIGMTGPSGCGKSTIIQLLLRFYDVDSGQILIDNVDIKDYDLKYLRRKIALVSQEPVLFDGSIEYNLQYSNTDISDVQLKAAAKSVNVTDLLEDADDRRIELGAASRSTESYKKTQGKQLSGGQKQRIAIARAMLRKPKIFLFDEITSALDTQSEIIVQNALKEITKGVTSIYIAHRLDSIKDSSCIMVVKDHVVIEQGTYKELIQKKGHFYSLTEDTH